MGRTENINVFQDTMNLCKNNDRIRESVHNSAEGQKLILEEDAIVESDKNRYKEKARITVSAKRTFENQNVWCVNDIIIVDWIMFCPVCHVESTPRIRSIQALKQPGTSA